MAISLLPLTVNNVNGNYTPNCLLYGMFTLNINGDVVIQPPINVATGQLFSVRINGNGGGSFSFHADYIAQISMYGGVPPNVGDFYQGLFVYDGSKCIAMSQVYKEF